MSVGPDRIRRAAAAIPAAVATIQLPNAAVSVSTTVWRRRIPGY